ncbi:twin-arginine translocase subunit TatC [Sporosarcina highlanderae]|uniref:Sec-independent protein translocase protein TatC n=1 Tax=Sporosarcina highlanderae TaxID=3035916 RepID=A0ABT8JM87_9BACL|nr:twin-arginine translocase subunit TatC [Sporosarcina highlanderae]MDN4606273.1 twin-arginine translocase subunit TatC [Sporosarcina highlanderae]
MDPYGDHHRKFLSPLDKKDLTKKNEFVGEGETATVIVTDVGTAKEVTSVKADDPIADPPLVEHLTDLRKQLIKSAVIFIAFFIGVFATINLWFPVVTRGHELIVLGPMEVVVFYMSISTALAFGLSLPFLCHFLWQFVKPGLNTKEQQFLSLYSPVMFFLFLVGLAFGYFVVNPLSYGFLVSLGAVNFKVMVSAQEYAKFLLMTTMPIGLLFELPIVAMFLAAIGVLTGDTLRKVRKWSYLTLAIVSALITPPDFVSQLIVLVPMMLLYEASIYIVLYMERRNVAVNE